MNILNSLSGKEEEFTPLHKNKVTIYVCGITPYDTTHLGHASTYISFDSLIRYLKFKGFEVLYTQNVTDVNDRDHDILDRAKRLHVSWKKLAEYWTEKFLADMHALNWIHPSHYVKASRHIHHMIDLIQELLDKGFAYRRNGSVYLDTAKISGYGKLSKLSKVEMMKVSLDFEEDLQCPEKKNPLDITLWRASSPDQLPHIPHFASPFGPGRPGWHIECSAMSMEYLGEQIDIHGGGTDLKFPHHEAEIAQSEGASGKAPFAKYWLHSGTVFYRGAKMSKSKGNLVMVSDLLKKYSPNAIRWLLLSNHWSKPWEYKEKDLIKAQKNVDTIESALVSPCTVRYRASQGVPLEASAINQFAAILDNNLDTPKALEFLLDLAKQKSPSLKNLYSSLGFKL